MRLTTKGLLLIAIPALFELALLAGVVEAEASATDAERWALHSQDVLRQTNAILEPVQFESVRLRGSAIGGDAGAATPIAMWMDIDRRIDQLVELVADNPSQVERAVRIRQAIQSYRQWSDRIQDLLRSGRRADVLERFRDPGAEAVLDQVRTQVAAFQQEERRLDVARTEDAAAGLVVAGAGFIISGPDAGLDVLPAAGSGLPGTASSGLGGSAALPCFSIRVITGLSQLPVIL